MAEVLKPAASGRFDAIAAPTRGDGKPRRRDRDACGRARGHGTPRRRRRLGARRRARRAQDAEPVGGKAHRRPAHRRRPGRPHRHARVARPRLPLARPQHADALARRAAAAAPGDADPLEPVRRRLRPRRADRRAPSQGRRALLAALDALKRSGNSIFVVEHDLATMRRADWIVDVGPDAGEKGGRVLYSGPPDGLAAVRASHTARYLFAAPAPRTRAPREPQRLARAARHHPQQPPATSTRAFRSAC